ncbi:DNA gyrase subunit A [Candidatus Cerribacteria bacterium 'Amazon FNV 2010 28 9']|uniref:DNA gyrase subunit A n=1 Tax=Candidatus Cerribacteria bacterium 'Amazon FNV 2010 28 9' TaxID=2081795 RepID=A0A317JRV0_9BACT|nr:MAG: DNA gyrase subunit A [Candidatus Cerribacteria bacterium 'Amazon FNV 2010 28 9']
MSDQPTISPETTQLVPVDTIFGKVLPVNIVDEMQKSYLDYAMSVIVARALPDVRDGLKPVHRRILYAMKEMGIRWNTPYKKSARIVGEVLGKYHPHGDAPVYEAMVRLAQDFSMRYQLVDGQGNYGSVDGDGAAAMRYTEARLAKITEELLADLEKNTVDFVDNFDGSLKEPSVLPAKLPNLLLMGSEGIAVGMATKIPPHNLKEVCEAILKVIEMGASIQQEGMTDLNVETGEAHHIAGHFDSQATNDDIMEYVSGPDFPTGGIIYDFKEIKEAYATGRGRILVRGVADIVENKNGKFQIIVSELPYQVNKAKLVAKIAQLARDKKLVGISDLRDESDRTGMRIAIDLKKDARPKSVLNALYKLTELQTTFPMNMVALSEEGTPQLMNIKTVLVEYIRHRQIVIVRRAQYDLKAARDRAHILEGLLIALAHLDDVIKTIRESADSDVAKANLMERFKLSQIQATAILDMQLRRLAALERQKIEDEYKQLKLIIDELLSLLTHPQKILDTVAGETKGLIDNHGDDRNTKLHKGKVGEISEEDLIPNEETIITVTETGYIKRLNPTVYRSQQRGGKGVVGMTTKEEDAVSELITCSTHDSLLLFTNKGRVFKTKVYDLPETGRAAKGQAIVNLVNLTQEENIQAILTFNEKNPSGQYIALATKKGLVKKTKLSEYNNIRTNGIIAIILKDGDELVFGRITTGEDHMMLVTHVGKSIRFSEKEIKSSARDTQGVKAVNLKDDDYVVGVESFPAEIETLVDKRRKAFRRLLVVTEHGMGKQTEFGEYPLQKRSGMGVKVSELTTKTGLIACAKIVDETIDELVITTKDAQVIKLPVKNIPVLKRPTQGVILMRLEKGDKVTACATTKRIVQDEE